MKNLAELAAEAALPLLFRNAENTIGELNEWAQRILIRQALINPIHFVRLLELAKKSLPVAKIIFSNQDCYSLLAHKYSQSTINSWMEAGREVDIDKKTGGYLLKIFLAHNDIELAKEVLYNSDLIARFSPDNIKVIRKFYEERSTKWADIPQEIIGNHILPLLAPKELHCYSQLSRRDYELANRDSLWKVWLKGESRPSSAKKYFLNFPGQRINHVGCDKKGRLFKISQESNLPFELANKIRSEGFSKKVTVNMTAEQIIGLAKKELENEDPLEARNWYVKW